MKQVRPIPRLPNDPDSRLHRKLDSQIVLLRAIWSLLEDQRQRAIKKDRERRT